MHKHNYMHLKHDAKIRKKIQFQTQNLRTFSHKQFHLCPDAPALTSFNPASFLHQSWVVILYMKKEQSDNDAVTMLV